MNIIKKTRNLFFLILCSFLLSCPGWRIGTGLYRDTTDSEFHTPLTNPFSGPKAGYNGGAIVPPEAGLVDVTNPDHVIGHGSPESCTAEDFIDAVAQGGIITFDTGGQKLVLYLDRPAKIFNNKPDIVIDGKGLVTLSGSGKTRILYLNTGDKNQVWTTDHSQNQEHPQLVVQNLIFADGNSTSDAVNTGGGAIFASGGRFKAVNCRFFNNVCFSKGPDLGGAAIRVFNQYNGQPVYITNCTFGGEKGYGNYGANGGAISSIGVSWTIRNSLFSWNNCTGWGGNPSDPGTPGGGSGGAIYNDGNTMTLTIQGCLIENNTVKAYGGAIFFVSNDHTGNITISDSIIRNNPGGSWYPLYPGISMHSDTPCAVTNSIIQN